MITKKAEYAIIALADLAVLRPIKKQRHGKLSHASKSHPTCSQILPVMRKAGWIKSTRGPVEGFFCARIRADHFMGSNRAD